MAFFTAEKLILLGLIVALIVLASTDRIITKIMIDRMSNYTYFLAELISFIYVPVMGVIVIYKRYISKTITDEMMRFPVLSYLIIAVFDTLGGLLILIPGSKVDGPLMTLMLQGIIPVTMVFSIIFLKKRFKLLHYFSALIIITGLAIDMMPLFLNSKNSQINAKYSTGTVIIYSIVLFASNIPNSLSGVYKEYALKQDLDVYLLNLWVALFQFLMGLPLAPFAYRLQTPNGHYLDVFKNLKEGGECFLLGKNFHPADQCPNVIFIVLAYIVINIGYNIIISYVLQFGSAVLLFNSMTIAVPIAFFAFAIKFIQDPPVKITYWSIIGCLLVVAGLIVYHCVPEPEPDQRPQETPSSIANPEPAVISPSSPESPTTPFIPKTEPISASPLRTVSSMVIVGSTGSWVRPSTPLYSPVVRQSKFGEEEL